MNVCPEATSVIGRGFTLEAGSHKETAGKDRPPRLPDDWIPSLTFETHKEEYEPQVVMSHQTHDGARHKHNGTPVILLIG